MNMPSPEGGATAQGIEGVAETLFPKPRRVATGPERTAEPRKARFFAEQKMRPNEILKKPPVSVNSLQAEAQ
jgi:hypothetical protein